MTKTQITWNGDFANDRKTGVVVSEVSGLVRIRWTDGTETVVPADIITVRHGWSRS